MYTESLGLPLDLLEQQFYRLFMSKTETEKEGIGDSSDQKDNSHRIWLDLLIGLIAFALLYNRVKTIGKDREIAFKELPEDIQRTMMSDDTPTFQLEEGEKIKTTRGTVISREDGTLKISND